MTLWWRILLLFNFRGRAVQSRSEGPHAEPDYVAEQQQGLLRTLKQGLVEVAISRRQLQQQVESLHARVPRLEDQARRALVAGCEDLARLALERKQVVLAELAGLERQVGEMGEEEGQLTLAERQLAAHIEDLYRDRQDLATRDVAAEAPVRGPEVVSGIAQEFAKLRMAVERAEEKASDTLAHASAVGVLIDRSVLGPPDGTVDTLERELREATDREAVEAELAALQVELAKAVKSGKLWP